MTTDREALIEEIASDARNKFLKDTVGMTFNTAEWAIREYIRRSAGKEKG